MINLLKHISIRKLRRDKAKTKLKQQLWEAQRPLKEIQNKIDEEKKDLNKKHFQIKFPSWSKIFLAFLFINFTILEIFIGYVTIKTFYIALNVGMMPDFTPLITLIGAVIGQTLSYGIYTIKSKAENIEGGITYEMAKMQMEQQNVDNLEGGCG